MTPHSCPVCAGRGRVSQGFYTSTNGEGSWVTNGLDTEACRSCYGTGVVWAPGQVPPPREKHLKLSRPPRLFS